MSLASLLTDRFKTRTRGVEYPQGVAALGVAPAIVLGSNPNRLGWTIVNLSANLVYLAKTNAVAATRGILLEANGGVASSAWDTDFNCVADEVWGLASGAASAIYAFEVIEY